MELHNRTLGRIVYRELLMSEGPRRRFTAGCAEKAERSSGSWITGEDARSSTIFRSIFSAFFAYSAVKFLSVFQLYRC